MQAVTREQMGRLDEICGALGVGTAKLMENAGERVAELAEKMVKEGAGESGRNIVVLCGHGNNGGDGLCAARKLAERGSAVTVFLASPREKFSGEPLRQLKQAGRAGVGVAEAREKEELAAFDLVIDALLGFNLKGPPRGSFAGLIRAANESGRRILAVDLPSGLDADTGEAFEPCIRATATLTLAYPKKGLLEEGAREFVGKLFVADIGVPEEACRRMGLEPVDFRGQSILPIAAPMR